jgi:hypothetical protein
MLPSHRTTAAPSPLAILTRDFSRALTRARHGPALEPGCGVIVRTWRDDTGHVRGVVENVKTGEKRAFDRIDRIDRTLTRLFIG